MMNLEDYKNLDFINALLQTPDQVIDKLDLIYVYDDSLSIERIKKEKDFDYLHKGKPLRDSDQLERIDNLVIPPAWQQVKIAYPFNGHLQAVGRDLKNRKQYRYHPLWNQVRNQTKFLKMVVVVVGRVRICGSKDILDLPPNLSLLSMCATLRDRRSESPYISEQTPPHLSKF